MKTTIDQAGRIVLPKAIREAAHLQDGTELEIRVVGDHIEIEPVHLDVDLVRKGNFVVAVPKEPPPKLTKEQVEDTRRSIRDQRAAIKREEK